jgi:hypothetical protein
MKILFLTLTFCLASFFTHAQGKEAWQLDSHFITQENAEKAAEILKKQKSIYFQDGGCNNNSGSPNTIVKVKSVTVSPNYRGEFKGEFYSVEIKVKFGNGDIITRDVNLDWIEVKDEQGEWQNLALYMGLQKEDCEN